MVFLTLLIYHGVGRRASERTRTYSLSTTLLRNTIRSVHHGVLSYVSRLHPPSDCPAFRYFEYLRVRTMPMLEIPFRASNDSVSRHSFTAIMAGLFTLRPLQLAFQRNCLFRTLGRYKASRDCFKRYTRTLYSRIRSPPLFFFFFTRFLEYTIASACSLSKQRLR